jgi:phosphoglycolate phosphatase-like HAD superfamily hydrolase
VKTIIFDMDGVLFDTERFGRKAWDAAGKHFGIEGLGDVSLQCIGTNAARTKEIITEAYHGKIPYDEVRSWRSEYAHRYFRENGMPMNRASGNCFPGCGRKDGRRVFPHRRAAKPWKKNWRSRV